MKTFKKFNLNLFAALFIIFTASNQMCMAQSGFVKNKGQLFGTDSLQHPEIKYYGNAGNTTLFLNDSVFSYVFAEADTDRTMSDSLHTYFIVDTLYRTDMKLKSFSHGYSITATDTSQGYNNYFYGDSSWTHALTYQVIKYSGIYSGVDLSFYNNDEFHFNLASNAANSIKIYYQGTDSVRVLHDTVLCIYTPLGRKTYLIKAYEYNTGNWVPFAANFQKTDSIISFTLGTHHTGAAVMLKVISVPVAAPPPNNLRWSTYYCETTAAGTDETFMDIFIDESDNVYAVGQTISEFFPLYQNIQLLNNGDYDAVVVKFLTDRNREFSTFYGGSERDLGTAITVDGSDHVIFAGTTSSDVDFPPCAVCTGGGYQQSFGGGNSDAFVVKLKFDGTYDPTTSKSTYYGGSGDESYIKIAIDNADNFVIVGKSTDDVPCPPGGSCSSQSGFYHDHNGGGNDGFLAQFDVDNYLVWATNLGGSSNDEILNVCTDEDQSIYAIGITNSTATSVFTGYFTSYNGTAFPVGSWTVSANCPYREGNQGNYDYFVSKFDGAGHNLAWSTEFGGANKEAGGGDIAVSPLNGDIFITGSTSSDEPNDHFPIVTSASGDWNEDTKANNSDAFIAKFEAGGCLRWSSYYGGNASDVGACIAVNNNGDVYVAGFGNSSDLTTLSSICQLYNDNSYNGLIEGFLLRFDHDANYIYGTYFGGASWDFIKGMACQKDYLNNETNIVITGNTNSQWSQGFPLYDPNSGFDYYQDFLPTGSHPFVTNLLDLFGCRIAGDGKETNETIISVFPNPSAGIVFISSSGIEMGSVRIIDIMGKIIFKSPGITTNMFKCDLNKLPDGIYFSEVSVAGIIYRNKIIIAH